MPEPDRRGAWVTGASRGIGRAVAIELARRGYDVVASMRNPEDGRALADEAGAGARIRAVALDVDAPATVGFPDGLRVLVNNAGLDAATLPVEHAPLDAWRAVFETNLFGLVAVTQQAIPALRASGGGVVCNLSSASLLFPMPFFAIYRASKAAVAALGESLRAELAPLGIRVIEVMPGPVDTDMLSESEAREAGPVLAGYEALSAWSARSRGAMQVATPVADAARAIVDAIEDPDAPLRVACDPIGAAMIAGADSAPYEARLRGAIATMRREPGD